MPAQYILRRSTNNQYYFSLTAENNEKILTSELYRSKDGALGGIQAVRSNSPFDQRYSRLTATNGQNYFVLKALNNEVIGTSEMYNTTQARENGIAAVKRVGPLALINDQT
jgi:uncharacterized protein YegP (UPF0339 family)